MRHDGVVSGDPAEHPPEPDGPLLHHGVEPMGFAGVLGILELALWVATDEGPERGEALIVVRAGRPYHQAYSPGQPHHLGVRPDGSPPTRSRLH